MRRFILTACSITIIAHFMAGCTGGASTNLPTPSALPPAETASSLPGPTALPTPVPTPLPSPTPGPRAETILAQAGSVCNANKKDMPEKAIEGLHPQAPLMTVLNPGLDVDDWQYAPFLFYVEAYTADSVRTLVCVWETFKTVGSYNDGESALQRFWYVQIVTWPDGELLAAENFEGGNPPQSKIADSGPGIGEPPYGDVEQWLLPAIPLGNDLLYTSFMPTGLTFSADGQTLLVSGNSSEKQVWDLANNSVTQPVASAEVIPVSNPPVFPSYNLVAPDGSPLIIKIMTTLPMAQDFLAQITSGTILTDAGPISSYLTVTTSSDGKWLAAAMQIDVMEQVKHPAVLVWDIASGAIVATVETENPFYFEHLTFSPDRSKLLLTSIPLSQLWDTGTWQLEQEFPNASAATFSPDGKYLAIGYLQGAVNIFDTSGPTLINLETGEQQVLSGYHESNWKILVYSPDGKKLASSNFGNFVKIWTIH